METALEALERGEAYGCQSGVRSHGLTWHIDRRTTQRASTAVLTGTGMAMAVKGMEPQPDPSPEREEDDMCQFTGCYGSVIAGHDQSLSWRTAVRGAMGCGCKGRLGQLPRH